MPYLLDTSVYSQPLKNRPVAAALRHWMRAGDKNFFTCEVCLAEVEYGLSNPNVANVFWQTVYKMLFSKRF